MLEGWDCEGFFFRVWVVRVSIIRWLFMGSVRFE